MPLSGSHMMASLSTIVNSRAKRSLDLSSKTVPLKSRKKVIAAVTVFIAIFLVLHLKFLDPKEMKTPVSSASAFETRTGISSFETTKAVWEATIADPVSVIDASNADNTQVEERVAVKDADAKSAPVSDGGADLDDAVSKSEKETVNKPDFASADYDVPKGEPGKCLNHVLYDKPVKTGSTAISFAIREFLATRGEKDKSCAGKGPLSCVERAKSICNGTVAEKDYFSILGHLRFGGRELAECLRPKFYIVSSVREPYQRRKSAYLWNRTLNGTHFNIPYTASFKEFMNRMPRCQLHHYYDGRGWDCDVGMSLEDRMQDIVNRVDEIIDVYDEPVGPLHKLIARYLRRENESIKIDEKDYLEDFDKDTLKEEQLLYDRLRAKRLQPPNKDRLLC